MRYSQRNGHATTNSSLTDKKQLYSNKQEWDEHVPFPRLNFTFAAGLVFVVAVGCFVNSYDGEFVFDDSEAIINNKDLLPETPVWDLFKHDFWGKRLTWNASHKSYRPLTVLTFRLNYYLAGGLHPLGFHVTNIVLHGVVCVLMLVVFSVLFGGHAILRHELAEFSSPKAASLCAILFAVHPIHTESVSAIVGRADLLYSILFLLAFLCYVKSCCCYDDCRPPSFSVPTLLFGLVLCALSMLCKEQGITVIGVCSAYDIIIVCKVDPLMALRQRELPHREENGNSIAGKSSKKVSPPWIRALVYRHILLLVAGLIILSVRLRLMGSEAPTFQVFDNPHSFVNGTFFRALNYNYLYAMNGWLLLNPWWLCFDWSMGCIPVITTVTDPRILAVIALWCIVGFILHYCIVGCIDNEKRVLTLALALIIIPFLPATNILFRVGFVIAERILYVSCAGFCMMVVLGLRNVCKTVPKLTGIVKLTLPIFIAIYIVQSVHRSSEWQNEMTLFSSGVAVCPLNAKVHYNIAKLKADSGYGEEAMEKYRLAIKLNPIYDQAMNNLANLLKDRGEVVEAESLLEKAVGLRTDFAAAWMNLGIVQAALNKSEASETSYIRAIQHRKKYPDCYYNLGNLYLETGHPGSALLAWRNATLQKPTHLNAWSNMIILLDNQGQLKEAEAITKEAMRYLPNESQMYYNLGNIYGKFERFEDSEKAFLKAIQLAPESAQNYANLGVLYHRWNKFALAEKAYKKSLELSPNAKTTMENLQMLHKKMKNG